MERREASMAISCIWAWIVPHIYIEFQEYRLALEKVYSKSAVSNNDSSSLEHFIKGDSSRKKALEATFRGSLWALAFISAIYVTSALVIGYLTCQPGENKILLTKPDAIAVGVGRMLSAGLLAYFSVEIPRWLGVSYSKVAGRYKEVAQAALAISYHELSVEVFWSLMGPFGVMYPFLVTYFCNESLGRVALSTMVGTAFGIVMVYCIWLGHTKLNFKKRTKIATILSVVISMLSAAAFSAGCWYLKTVWYSDSNRVVVHRYTAVTFVVWLAFCGIAHWICYRLTKRKLAEARASREEVNDNVDDTTTMEVGDNATELTFDEIPLLPKARTDVEAFDEITLGNGKSSSLGFIEEERVDSSIWHTAKVHYYCQRRKNYKASRKKGWNLGLSIFKWTLWALVATWHISFTIVNIGASFQQTVVRNALNTTYETLYPDNYTTGAMCAWQEPSETADIRTFDSLQDVMDMNYTVIHCGECGSCSNWNDLSLQWTTRDHLARKAKSCAAKSIGGSRDKVQKCNEESIGFTHECALCWTEDEHCARNNCFFIFLQSIFTNQVNNFNVGPDDITAATCDEALCGPKFVPCSGATRRRMNIISDISRPISQQCGVADGDWSKIFGNP